MRGRGSEEKTWHILHSLEEALSLLSHEGSSLRPSLSLSLSHHVSALEMKEVKIHASLAASALFRLWRAR